MKTEINKKYGIVALLFTVCSAISLISAVAYLITSADGALYRSEEHTSELQSR